MEYKEADIDEALDIFEHDVPNMEISNEATQINRYFNDDFYHISKDVKFIQYVFLMILCIAIILAIIAVFTHFF